MKLEVNKCDQCGAITENRYWHDGWICIEENTTVVLRKCKIEGKQNGFFSTDSFSDFCSLMCLRIFINKFLGDKNENN